MKKIFYLYIIMLGSLLTSCKDFLDLPPKNQRAVTTLNDIKSVLAGYLDAFSRNNIRPIVGPYPIITEAQNMMFESYSDNFDFEGNMAQYVNRQNNHGNEKFYANKLLWNDYETSTQIWNSYYEAIGFLNALIEQCEDLKDADPQELKRVKGEMMVHRAYYIFKLQQYFAPMDREEMGIPLYLHTGKEVMGIEMKRKPSAEIYAVLINDLSQALSYYTEAGANTGYNRFFNDRFIQHLLAQVFWFKAESSAKESSDYQQVIKYATAALENVEAFVPSTPVALQQTQQNLLSQYPAYYMQGMTYGGVSAIYGSTWDYLGFAPANLKVAPDLLQLFDEQDIRKAAYFNGNTLSASWPDGAAYGAKYVRVHLFTPEEAFLMLAEAYCRSNNLDQGRMVLNTFKGYRNAKELNSGSANELLKEIINERRKEFFTDTDKRWIDLKRYKLGTINRTLKFFNIDFSLRVEAGDFHYSLPIPLSELQENPHIVPNEGWEPLIF